MVQLTPEQRVLVVKTYFQTEKYTEVRRLFRERYTERPLNKTTIWKNVNATSLNKNKGRSGRKRVAKKTWIIFQGFPEQVGFPVVITG